MILPDESMDFESIIESSWTDAELANLRAAAADEE